MTTLGRVVVAIVVAGVLVGATALTMRLFKQSDGDVPKGPGAEAPAVPPAPEKAGKPVAPKPPGADWFKDHQPPKTVTVDEKAPPQPPRPPGKPPEPKPPQPPTPPEPAPADPTTARGSDLADQGLAFHEQGRPLEAQKRLSEALRAGIGGAKGKLVRKTLHELADRIQLAKAPVPNAPYTETYRVVSGDTLSDIGKRFLVPYELIRRINGLPSTSITADQHLKVVRGPLHVRVSKRGFELQAWLADVCLRTFPVGLGTDNRTPEGTFLVERKIKDPPYQPQHKPRSEHRPPGAPDNPLGTRWIDIGNHYGIHGTIEPASIGRAVSEGCIRMHNRDVEELYDMVVAGASKVEIVP